MAAITICSHFRATQNKVWHCFPIYLPGSDETRCCDLSFLNAEFQVRVFTLFSPLSRSSLVPLCFLLLEWWHLLIWGGYFSQQSWFYLEPHPAQHFTWCTLYKLNKQSDNIVLIYSFLSFEPVLCSRSSSNCCFLTWIQISQEADYVVWYSHLLKNFPQFVVIHTVKGFGVNQK